MDDRVPGDQYKNVPATFSEGGLPTTDLRRPLPDFEDAVDLRDYLDVVLRRKWLILTVLVGVFVTTLVVSLTMKPVFKASGGLELSPQEARVTKFEDVVATQLQTREFIQTQVKLLQSGSLATRVIERLNLAEHSIFNEAEEPGVLQKWKANITGTVKEWLQAMASTHESEPDEGHGLDLDRLRKDKSMATWFAQNLQVQPERDTTLINVSFSATDPALAQDAINTLIREFIGWQMDKRIEAASSAKHQLHKQIEVSRIQLEKAESELNKFAQKAGIVSLDSKLNLIYRQLEEMNRALAEAQAERVSKEALYAEAIRLSSGALPQIIDNPLIQKLREQYVQLKAEYEQMRDTFKDDYPTLKSLKAKMLDTQRRIKDEETRILDSIINDYSVALRKEGSLKKESEEKKELALDLNNRATQYKILEREVETNKEIYQSLLSRAKEIDANVGTDLSNIRVVDYADLPLTPYKPNVRLNLLLALVVGLMGGVGLAFFLEYLDDTVKGLDEISDRFHIPVLGVVPLANQDELKDLDNLVLLKPRAGFSEAVRTAKVSVQLSSYMEQAPKSLLITSTAQQEGKSTLSANLAQAFASSDEKVVLLDVDLRKPRLHKVFCNNGQHKGISQILTGLCRLDEAVIKSEVPNLYFIPAGPIPPNPAELLASNRMRKLLDTLCNHFDYVIIDAPPATGFADVLALCSYVHGIILISILGHTHREALRIFRKSLHNVGGNLLGSVINKLDMRHQYGAYYNKYYKYYYSYYQPYGEKSENLLPKETL
ncbi:MAG: polysaccharide biosynthesis tyrosine autokinase [Desulforhabdus sp.]|jgi:capsular exopolysaccharide synthesis family protein|nr:polysaccharide biosynthesis tyrosine autokinase [Desulforhabdus sp.]